MSTYYNFYAGKKNKDGIFEFVGPYLKNKNGELEISTLFWRSRSFIRWDGFDAIQIPVEKMSEEVAELCASESFAAFNNGEVEKYSIGYWIPLSTLKSLGSDEPIRGFLPVEEAIQLIASNYDSEFIEWNMEGNPIPAEVIAGMSNEERSKYSFVSYIDKFSVAYQANFIYCALVEYDDYYLIDESEEFGTIVQVG